MNIKEIENFIKIAEEKNITKAAEKLFLTPSALNQQLLHLERDLGVPLFFRAKTGLTLTEAGKIYFAKAKEMVALKKATYHQLQDIAAVKKSTLSISLPPERGAAMFTQVYPEFHRRYPYIALNVIETHVKNQQRLIETGEVDIGFMTLSDNQKTDDHYLPIATEELVLALHKENPLCRQAKRTQGRYPELELALFKQEDFALIAKNSTLFPHIEVLFRQNEIIPHVIFETSRLNTILDMVNANICCGIVTYSASLSPHPNVRYFSLPNQPSWQIVASYKKGSYLNEAAKAFIQLATDYWKMLLQ